MQLRRHGRNRQWLPRQGQEETRTIQDLPVSVGVRRGPHSSDFYFASRLQLLHHLRRRAALLVDVSLDDLRRQTRRQPPMLAPFEQHYHNDVRITPRGESHEPSILVESLVVSMLRPCGEGDHLCRASFAGYINSGNVRRWGCALRQYYASHGVGDEVPPVRVNGNVLHIRVVIDLNISLRKP